MKKSALLLGMFIVILTACTEETPPPNCGTIKFSWKANGTYYEGSSNYHFEPGVSNLHSFGFTACTNSANSPSLSVRLHEPLMAGTYQLADVNDADTAWEGDGSYLDGTGSGYYGTLASHQGSLTITAIAPDSAITGYFGFNTLHSTSTATINITEGTFTAIPQ